jgi:glycosyltransferase involved in cell wall biosynthesis
MCLRTLVISSDCGAGPREILEYGENGVLFSVGDEVRLSSIITQIALSKAEAENQEFISKAFKSVDRFSPETAISIFYKVL